MDCKKCGTPAVEGAVYCHNCGARVDGKKPCPRCHQLNDDGFKFCIHCGTRIDGKATCKNCGAEHEGEFCPNCGTRSSQTKAPKKCVEKVNSGGTYARIMKIIGLSLGMFAAFIALVFSLFIGFDANEGKNTIFYYFVDVFKDLKETVNMVSTFKGPVKALTYFDAISSCVIAVATLIGVITFFTLTTVRFVKAICGKETRSPLTMALWTAFFYVGGSALLYPYGAGEAMGVKMGYNGATIAGLILVFVSLLATVTCFLLTNLQQFKEKSFIVRLIRCAVSITFGLVAFFMVRNAWLKGIVIIEKTSVDVKGCPGAIAAFFLGLFSELYAGNPHLGFETGMLSAMGIVATTLALISTVFVLLSVFKSVRNLIGEDKKTGLVGSIVSAALTIGALICSILLWKQAALIVNTTEVTLGDVSVGIKCDYALMILAVVFTVIHCGVAIANKIVAKKFDAQDEE